MRKIAPMEGAPDIESIEGGTDHDDELFARLQRIEQDLDDLRSKAVQRVLDAEAQLEAARKALARIDGLLGGAVTKTAPDIPSYPRNAGRGHWHSVVGDVLREHPGGLRKRNLIEALGIREDRKQQANLSSALQLMKRSGQISQDQEGRYNMA